MTSCAIVSEGFDLPAIEAAILLRPTQSLSLYLQQVGRALRVLPGKPCAYILDHVGNVLRHGLPDDEREWSLDGAKKRRKNEVAPVSVMRCHVCYAMFRSGAYCPQCGAAMIAGQQRQEIKQVEGTLVEITPEQRKAQQIAKKRDISACRTHAELTQHLKQDTNSQSPSQRASRTIMARCLKMPPPFNGFKNQSDLKKVDRWLKDCYLFDIGGSYYQRMLHTDYRKKYPETEGWTGFYDAIIKRASQ
jgi:superfamily II DNA or RNA helicase